MSTFKKLISKHHPNWKPKRQEPTTLRTALLDYGFELDYFFTNDGQTVLSLPQNPFNLTVRVFIIHGGGVIVWHGIGTRGKLDKIVYHPGMDGRDRIFKDVCNLVDNLIGKCNKTTNK